MRKIVSSSVAALAIVSLVGLTACPGGPAPKPSPSVSAPVTSAKAEKLLSDVAPALASQKIATVIKTSDNKEVPVELKFSGDGKQSEAEVTSETAPGKLVIGGVEYTNFKEGSSSFGTKQTRKVWVSSTVSVTITLINALSSPTISFVFQDANGQTLGQATGTAEQFLSTGLVNKFQELKTAIQEVIAEAAASGQSGPSGSAG